MLPEAMLPEAMLPEAMLPEAMLPEAMLPEVHYQNKLNLLKQQFCFCSVVISRG